MRVRYLDNVAERYKAVPAKDDGGEKKYKMKNTGRLIEYPNNCIIQSVAKRFNTQQGLEPIYSMSYGINWAAFVGRDMTKQLALDIEAEVSEALGVSPFVSGVSVEVGAVNYNSVIVNVEVAVKPEYTSDGKSATFWLTKSVKV